MLTLLSQEQADLGSERRRDLRIPQARPIKMLDPSISRYFGGQTQDISSTGLRLELPQSIPVRPGKMVSIHVDLNEHGQALANRRQMIPARIVWVDRDADPTGKTLHAGIEFLASISAQLNAA